MNENQEPVVEMEVEEVPSKEGAKAQAKPEDKKKKEAPKIVGKWSWGGFGLSWLYAICHGMKWAWIFPASIVISALSPLVLIIPIVGEVVVGLAGMVVGLYVPALWVLRVILGIKGHGWAWDKFKGTPEEFVEKQKLWDRVGAFFFFGKLILGFLSFVASVVLTVLGVFVGLTDILDWAEYLMRHFS